MPLIEDLTFFALFFLVGTFLLKLYNILYSCKVYDIQKSIIVLIVGTISYLFIEIGLYLNLNLEFNIYFWFARVLLLLVWVFWFAEIMIYASQSAVEATEAFTRMNKRKNERMKNSFNRGY